MIVNVPAYDKNYFIQNGLVWGSFRGQLKSVQTVFDTSYVIGFSAITKNALIFTAEQFSGYILMRPWMMRGSLVYPDSSQYFKTQWQKTFVFPQMNTQNTEAKDLDNTYVSSAPFTPKANGIEYVAQDNPIVDFLVSTISVKEPDYVFIPVGGHVG
ncbi:hypothetical protein JA33_078 [Dickeya phage vB_DsoM_JA33]|uniref:Uncharacterized protein n=2 Tax=Salmondvirus JA11 TaxID=2734141 RepID=A0A386K6B8_9CAUD|nr:hypothetical protein HOU32_gp078 [Dickeya phage vB_DsoM_JA11]AXG67452.1 hypothetical protein JA33_078 [Dickeya phage vB_DsoM_JA33]AYD79883.1 hypothetical protein JA11_078 [Dickeya phage vB_DsoM_JA11]